MTVVNKNWRGPIWLVAGLAATGAAAAAERPASWQCANCPFPAGLKLDTTAGAGYQSEASYKFGDYTGLDDDGTYFIGDFRADYYGEGAMRWQMEGTKLGLDSRQIGVEGGWQGLLEFRAGYDELPRYLFETAVTPYPSPGNEFLALPAGWVTAPSTGGMTALATSLRPVDVEWKRETWDAGASFIQSPRLRYDLDYRHLERDGKRLWGGSFLTAATILPRPLNDETDTVEAGITYAADTWNARVGYLGSFYSNGTDRLNWENAFTAPAPGADDGQAALEPDNDFQQIMVTGDYHGWDRTRITGRLALGKMEQDQRLLPYTVNPNLAGGALPRTRLNGEVDTIHGDLRLSSRPLPKLRLRGDLVYDKRDNKTDRDSWNYVITDSFAASQPSENLPYGYEHYRVAFSGSYRFPFGTTGQLGYQYDNNQRDFTAVNETEDNEVWAELSLSPLDMADLRLKYSYASRDGDGYKPLASTQPPQNPLMRIYSFANRDRESLEVSLTVQPLERLDLSFSGLFAEDDYDNGDLGLNKGEYRNWALDAGLRLPGESVLTGQVGYDKFETKQFGSQAFSTPDWSANQQDESWIAGLSLELPKLIERLRARVGYTYIDTKGEIRNDTNGLNSAFPDLETSRHRVEAELTYELRKNIDIGLAYLYEDYDVDDWTVDGLAPNTVNNLLATGARWQGYDVSLVTLSFTWSLDR